MDRSKNCMSFNWNWRVALVIAGIALAVYLLMPTRVKQATNEQNAVHISAPQKAKSDKPPGLKSMESPPEAASSLHVETPRPEPVEEAAPWTPVDILPSEVLAEGEDSPDAAQAYEEQDLSEITHSSHSRHGWSPGVGRGRR